MAIYQVLIYFVVLLALVKPLGWYMAWAYEGFGNPRVIRAFEGFLCRTCSIQTHQEMNWKEYLSALLIFNGIGFFVLYILQRMQAYLPLNPQSFSALTPDLAFNSAASFVTNTNWQAYGGESTMSYLTQMLALTVQNFLSAATGMSLLVAFIRGLVRGESSHLGNFWVDTLRGILYILLPLSLLLATLLCSQGVIQNFKPNQKITLLQKISLQPSSPDVVEQVIPMGPVASQVAIKQLGTNGGGFFNTNSAHPFENPNPWTNFLEMLAILLIPASFCYTFGLMVKDKRQGWALLVAMFVIFIPFTFFTVWAEWKGNPALYSMDLTPAGNMEGKETRFGVVNSALWATATTASSNGSVNSMHDSYTPLGGFVPLLMMHFNEVIFGGVGSGLYGMLILVIVTVFLAGLMVGRTPEYLGKKIEPFEMKMAALVVLIIPLLVLVLTAIASVTTAGTSALGNPEAHGFSEMLYAFSSMSSNNGSAFAGLHADLPFYNLLGGLAMLISRYWVAIPVLAIAGSLAHKKRIPSSLGTLPTYTPLFVILLVSLILLLGVLSFIPSLALGPLVEQIMLGKGQAAINPTPRGLSSGSRDLSPERDSKIPWTSRGTLEIGRGHGH